MSNNTPTLKANSQAQKPEGGDLGKISIGLLVLFASVALNGVFAGLLIANKAGPSPQEMHLTTKNERPDMPHIRRRPAYFSPDSPQALIAALPKARRREIMSSAMKQLDPDTDRRPRVLFKELHASHRQTGKLLQADTVDYEALQKLLAHNRTLKEELALQTDALTLEILKQLSPEERKTIKLMPTRKLKRKKDKHKMKKD